MTSIPIKGTVLKISEAIVNNQTGFVKKVMKFHPKDGKVFYPEFHYQKIKLLEEVKEGDELIINVMIWGYERDFGKTGNNIVVDGIQR